MKYKALALALGFLLLLMPLMPLISILPTSAHNGPWVPELYVTPPKKVFTGPCIVSTNFVIDVNLWNDKSLTTVGVYAYDFNVTWNNSTMPPSLFGVHSLSMITLVNVTVHIPTPWLNTSYFIIKNENKTNKDGGISYYHLAVTAVGSPVTNPALELGALTPFNASLVTLTFHIDNEPVWPYTYTTPFGLNCALSGDVPDPITGVDTLVPLPLTMTEQDNGTLIIHSSQPNIDPEATLAPINGTYPANITVNAVNMTEAVFIHLTNVANGYSFYFELQYNPLWKQTDVQHIKVLTGFPPPYETLYEHVDNTTGLIIFNLTRPSEKPPICGKDVPVVEIDFTSTLTPEIGTVPTPKTTYFQIINATMDAKVGTTTYNYTFANLKAIAKADDRLVAMQSATDHGWDWVITGLTAHSGSASSSNLYGVIADELIDSYLETGNKSYLTAAESAASFMMYGDPTAGDFWNGYPPGTLYGFGYSFDYMFLMHLSAVTGDPSYSTYATAAWTWQRAHIAQYASGAALWAYLIAAGRTPGMAAWDISGFGLVALQMGDTAFAQQCANVIVLYEGSIYYDAVNGDLGMGEAVAFLATAGFPDTVTPYEPYSIVLSDFINRLEHIDQQTDGAFLSSGVKSTQATAYAVMGLWTAGEFDAAQKGADYLAGLQLPNGGWLESTADPREYSETDAEAVTALFMATSHSLAYSYDLPEIFTPKGYHKATATVPQINSADLNLDGVVDILDLSAIAKVYGNSSSDVWINGPPVQYQHWSDLALPPDPAKVDIYDIVYVAKHFGDP